MYLVSILPSPGSPVIIYSIYFADVCLANCSWSWTCDEVAVMIYTLSWSQFYTLMLLRFARCATFDFPFHPSASWNVYLWNSKILLHNYKIWTCKFSGCYLSGLRSCRLIISDNWQSVPKNEGSRLHPQCYANNIYKLPQHLEAIWIHFNANLIVCPANFFSFFPSCSCVSTEQWTERHTSLKRVICAQSECLHCKPWCWHAMR